MNASLLIDSVVRQVTVLVAQLATSGGVRAPVAHIANQVFLELSKELSAQGISRKVSADMFGMALRAYIRKLRRISEGNTEQGHTLWQAVLNFTRSQSVVSRERLLKRFEHDGELEVSAILRDLVESGLVFSSGSGKATAYRAATDEELGELSRLSNDAGSDELVWVWIFRSGPVTENDLALQLSRPREELAPSLERLLADGRLRRLDDGRLHAQEFLIPMGASVGWEAAVFDHFQAVVQTITQRLRATSDTDNGGERPWVGGSTYTFDVWPEHPMEAEVKSQLEELRQRCGDLRRRVSEYNDDNGIKPHYEQVTTYVGQCGIQRELGEREE